MLCQPSPMVSTARAKLLRLVSSVANRREPNTWASELMRNVECHSSTVDRRNPISRIWAAPMVWVVAAATAASAAVATPPDMASQIILFAVIYPLYEVSIHLVSRIERQKLAQMRADGLVGPDEDMYGNKLTPEDAAKS